MLLSGFVGLSVYVLAQSLLDHLQRMCGFMPLLRVCLSSLHFY